MAGKVAYKRRKVQMDNKEETEMATPTPQLPDYPKEEDMTGRSKGVLR